MIYEPLDILPHHPVGGKAHALASLTQANFKVPSWIVITEGEFSLPPLKGLQAVRSSAVAEDGTASSFAGQFDSFLNVEPDEITLHVEKVRQSASSQRLDTYTKSQGQTEQQKVSVIVQEMVDARFAGVAFGADPVTGERGIALISAVAGLGEKLVSGEVDSENWRISSDKKVEGTSNLLTQDQLLAIARLVRCCNDHFGSPQDIEWAIDQSDTLWLLQSRPITTLAKLPDPSDQSTVWDNSNIAESYGGITSPLTFSFASRIYEHVYREFCKLLHVPKWKIEKNDEVFPQMLGHIHGHVYYNLVSWYRVLSLLPGFSVNRSFMEQMMGLKQPLPGEIIDGIIEKNQTSKWRDTLALVRTTIGLIRSFFGLPRQIESFQKRLNSALDGDLPLNRLTTAELIEHFRHLEKQLLHRWDAPLVNDFFAMVFYGILSKKVDDANRFLSDTGEIISARPPRLIREMADLARPHLELIKLLNSKATIARKIAEVRKFPEISSKLDHYLEEFGDRCLEELKLESPTVIDDPSSLLQSIGSFAAQPEKPSPVSSRKSISSGTGFLERFLIRKTRDLLRNRENLRFERTRLFGRVRRIMRELGNRLHADQQLESPEDVFYLTLDEVLEMARSQPLKALVATRRAEFDNYRSQEAPPDRFTTRGPLHRYSGFEPDSVPDGSSRSDLKGVGACPGVVRGPVRVVTDPRQATLEPGEILVATQTDPGWVVLFPAASGLLVERGSLLSHSAIVARELDLPCIVSLSNITRTLNTGELIEMNGQSGEVTLLSQFQPSTASPSQ